MQRVVPHHGQGYLSRTDLEVVEPHQANILKVLTVTTAQTVIVHELLGDLGTSILRGLTLTLGQIIPHDGLGQEVTVLNRLPQTFIQGSILGDQGVLTCGTDCRWQLVHLSLNELAQTASSQLLIFRLGIVTHGGQLTTLNQRVDAHAFEAVTDGLDLNTQATLFDRVSSCMKLGFCLNGSLLSSHILTNLGQLLRHTSYDRANRNTTGNQLQQVGHEVGQRNHHRLDHNQGTGILYHTLQQALSIHHVLECFVAEHSHRYFADILLSLRTPVAVTSPGIANSSRAITDHVVQHIFANPELTVRERSIDQVNSARGEQLQSIKHYRILVLESHIEQVHILGLVQRGFVHILPVHFGQLLNSHSIGLFSQHLFSQTAFPHTQQLGVILAVVQRGQSPWVS